MSTSPILRRAAVAAVIVVVSSVISAVPSQAVVCPTIGVGGAVSPALVSGSDWTGCDLTGADLTGVQVSGVTLDDANLTGADLTDASFASSSARAVNLTDASLVRTRMLGVDVTGAILDGASTAGIRGVNLTGAPAAPAAGKDRWTVESGWLVGPHADLSYVRLTGTDLSGRDLSGIDLSGATLDGLVLDGATLAGSTLTGTVVVRSSMRGTNLSGSSTTGYTRIDKITGTLGPLPGAGWKQVRDALVGPDTYLLEADLTSTDLRSVDLTGAVLYYPDFTGSDVSGVQFATSYLYMPRFYRVKATGTKFAGTLRSGDIVLSDVRGAVFTGGTLYNTGLVESNLTGAVFTGAKLNGVYWTGSICPDGAASRKHVGEECLKQLDTVAPTVTIRPLPTFVWSGWGQLSVVATAKDASSVDAIEWFAQDRPAMGGTTYKNFVQANGYDGSGVFNGWLSVSQGMRSCARARVTDHAGNVSSWSPYSCSTGVTDESSMDRSIGWRSYTNDKYWNQGYLTASRKGEWLRSYQSGRARQVGVVAATCPTCGSVAIYVGSTKVGSINLARPTTKSRTLLLLPRFTASKYGKVKVVVTSGSSSTVRIDAVAITGY